jgi:hypothetical protein
MGQTKDYLNPQSAPIGLDFALLGRSVSSHAMLNRLSDGRMAS